MNPWTAQDDKALKENAHRGADHCAALLNRTASSVRNRATQKGLSLKKPIEMIPCPHCHKPICKSGLQQHAVACKSNKEHGLERDQDTGRLKKIELVGQGLDTKLDETVFVPVTHLERDLETVQFESPIADLAEPIEHPGHSVKETRVPDREVIIPRSAVPGAGSLLQAALQQINGSDPDGGYLLPGAAISPPAHRFDLYCVYCHNYHNECECWLTARNHVTGEWELDIAMPAERKDWGQCQPHRTLLGHVRSLLGLEVG